MKKIYLCAMALSVGSFAMAQSNQQKTFSDAKLEIYNPASDATVKSNNIINKAAGDTIWSEDFTGGFPAGWTKGGTTNNGADWVINSAALSAPFTNTGPILSTSGGNHMLFFGETINPIADRDAYFQTAAIALTGQASVSVVFQQKFRLCCAAAAALNVVVSTDPTFATNVQTFDARGGIAINAMSPDPFVKHINISAIAGGVTGNIYLRFHWATGASHYFWMVDDIAVIETPLMDLVASNAYYGSAQGEVPYTRIPVAQNQPINFSIEVINQGAATQTGTIMTASINGGTAFAGTSTPVALAPAATDSLFPTTSFTPPTTIGVPYATSLELSSSTGHTDFLPSDNIMTFPPFEISQFIYALDDFGPLQDFGATNTIGNGGGPRPAPSTSVEFEAGNFFDVVSTQTLYAIDVVVGNSTTGATPVNIVGATIDAVLYEIDAQGNFVEIDRSNFYTVTSSDLRNKVRLELPNTPSVTAGTFYFVAVHALNPFFYGTSGASPGNGTRSGAVSLIFYPDMTGPNTNENFFTTQTPMVRMNFDPLNSVNELSNNTTFSVFPNPSNDIFNINLDAKNTEVVNLTVTNIVGQSVLSKRVTVSGQTKETISLADFDKGIYFLTIDNNNEKQTVKLIVE
ncbi:MAG: hypothetical protein CVT95_02995 [Bacteroidetes bacterium HGW-Bacteroidetes-12]|nr:MAG: hypothetical protein CVT95_02995 [Bacteroidetes bacterium HGW-Bacteroidetes-12]